MVVGSRRKNFLDGDGGDGDGAAVQGDGLFWGEGGGMQISKWQGRRIALRAATAPSAACKLTIADSR